MTQEKNKRIENKDKMIRFIPERLSKRERYKFLIGSMIPCPTALATSLLEDEVLNIVPFSYFNIVISNPSIVSLAI
ncbi:MAG TPA: hypothetical protein H9808_03305 [Candidatus Atopostipes pullistercoris]|uniref:Uncharacterized protein n=1 Tax=Candidatus Atopostipes pullistercoris TaxID=2838467 RepID=A0A9D2G1X2_9LACT|nr:hypothetical protein [Candidatus Atopostipes pullistercoris]